MGLDFLGTSLIVVIAPGTGVIYTLAMGLGRGRAASVFAAIGCTAGIVPHLLAAVLGLAAVLHASAVAFQAVKIAGVLFLLYMAWTMLRQRGTGGLTPDASAEEARGGGWAIAVRGFFLNILNPKLSLFFLAFLPQFVPAEGGTVAGMLGLGAVFMAMTLVVFICYGLAAAAVSRAIRARPALLTWLNRLFAGAFVALGARLALEQR